VAEGLLRLDGSFVCIGRTARHDTEIGGHQVKEGERRSCTGRPPTGTRPSSGTRTSSTRPVSGTGPHRCIGSNLARMNLRIALTEIAPRLRDVKLRPGAEIGWHSLFNRAPLAGPDHVQPRPRDGG
jgi:cytochrome P450